MCKLSRDSGGWQEEKRPFTAGSISVCFIPRSEAFFDNHFDCLTFNLFHQVHGEWNRQVGCDCPAQGTKKNDRQWGKDRREQCLFLFFCCCCSFSKSHFILRFEKKPRFGPPTANCLQCCSKFVQPQFDFGSWRGNRIVDDFSFGCTAGGLSASVLSPLPPFFPSPPRLFFTPFFFPPLERDVCVPPTQARGGCECRQERKTTEKKKLAAKEVKDSIKWATVACRKNGALAGKIS